MSGNPPPDANPFLWVPWLLLLSIGPLFFVVSAQAPLLQRWFALTNGGDPYPLYAASNLGSFGGLITYPLLVEPLLPVGQQRWLWSLGYGLLAAARRLVRVPLARAGTHQSSGGHRAGAERAPIVQWILLAAVPSGLILSTTLHITTDIIAMPLLWVLPLGVYLLSFTVAFAKRPAVRDLDHRASRRSCLLIACVRRVSATCPDRRGLARVAPRCSACSSFGGAPRRLVRSPRRTRAADHSSIWRCRSAARSAGLFCALVAPMIFDWTYEHRPASLRPPWLMGNRSPFDGSRTSGRGRGSPAG